MVDRGILRSLLLDMKSTLLRALSPFFGHSLDIGSGCPYALWFSVSGHANRGTVLLQCRELRLAPFIRQEYDRHEDCLDMQISFTVLGTTGYELPAGEIVCADFLLDRLALSSEADFRADIHYLEIVDLTVTGPGSVTTGGGFMGGGFGVEGALVGMGASSILNAITSQTKMHTFLNVITHSGEVYLHCGTLEPGVLRMILAPTFTALRRLDGDWLAQRMKRIEAYNAENRLSEEDYVQMKLRLQSIIEPPLYLSGYQVKTLAEGGNANMSGVKVDDVIVRYASQKIHSDDDLSTAIMSGHPKPYLLVLRQGQLLKLNVARGRLGMVGSIVTLR